MENRHLDTHPNCRATEPFTKEIFTINIEYPPSGLASSPIFVQKVKKVGRLKGLPIGEVFWQFISDILRVYPGPGKIGLKPYDFLRTRHLHEGYIS